MQRREWRGYKLPSTPELHLWHDYRPGLQWHPRPVKPRPQLSADAVAALSARFNVVEGGKRFHCEHLREGPVSYADRGLGIEVLRRSTIESANQSFIGKPLVIEHVNPRLNVADPEVRRVTVGFCDKVGMTPDGWAFVEGAFAPEVTDEQRADFAALNPSCGYNVIGVGSGGRWNNVPYERELTAIEFHHLALCRGRSRYEESEFRLNAITHPTGDKSMSFFTLFKKKPAALAGAAPVVEEIQIPADTTIKLPSGREVRLNDVVASQENADKDKAAVDAAETAAKAGETAAPIPAADTKPAEGAPAAATPAPVAEVKPEGQQAIDAANAAAEGRLNSTILVSGKPVTVRELAAAFEARENALAASRSQGAKDFAKLQNAALGKQDLGGYAKTAGTLEEGMTRGKY